ncbi:hypothetical protein LTR56_014307 [Elasticomyces elasticus]|nr:hypothetical protein LTR22_024719 [Elasticomyces elasticus]KAK3636144.1 hypothetical protein LTR56_014307 [Elasticomyces elasticus]KAK4916563.1 hypothetical protein LTR49_015396 [Elasticomyces elasticus]KAK5756200.1 hypothetical protein LTS12_013753 [Elasticomyces elasticus]
MAATTVLAKRKRAQVSYLDEDDELDELLEIRERFADVVDDESDDDLSFGSHKDPQAIKKRKAAKRAKKSPGITKSKKNEKTFPFERLPPELRDQIYELALTDENGITLVAKTNQYRRTVKRGTITENGGYGRRRRRYWQQPSQSQSQATQPAATRALCPALLAVSKQLHAEGVNYLYQQEIVLEDTYALHSFLATIGSNRSRLTDLTVKTWGSGGTHKAMNFCSFTLLGNCTNLQTLFLDCSIGWQRNPKGLARQLYRDGVYFFEQFGAANGAKDAAVDILELNDTNFDSGRGYWRRRNDPALEKDDFKDQCHAELRKLLAVKPARKARK